MLAGNMLFSLYEQTRADRLITIGMCAPIRARLIPMLNVLPGNEIKYIERLMSGRRHRNALIGRIERAAIRTLTSQYFATVQQDPNATREPPDTEVVPAGSA